MFLNIRAIYLYIFTQKFAYIMNPPDCEHIFCSSNLIVINLQKKYLHLVTKNPNSVENSINILTFQVQKVNLSSWDRKLLTNTSFIYLIDNQCTSKCGWIDIFSTCISKQLNKKDEKIQKPLKQRKMKSFLVWKKSPFGQIDHWLCSHSERDCFLYKKCPLDYFETHDRQNCIGLARWGTAAEVGIHY